ncbi:MAG: glutamate--tRNA ligase [Candidatus Eiseniibacteriota bacterium]
MSSPSTPSSPHASARPVRVRFAPSPTGSLHIGGARTALFNWLFARRHGGVFLLRSEDTDLARSTREAEKLVLGDLEWLGLSWEEGPDRGGPAGPYRQSERTALYRKRAEELLAAGKAFYCYCTDEELEAHRKAMQQAGKPPHYAGTCRNLTEAERNERRAAGKAEAIRFRVPGTIVRFHDHVRKDMEFGGDVVGDFVILRANGLPTYNFACVVDDADMAISHVIRAEEHLSNTPRQIMLYEALGLSVPEFAHVPLILNSDRTKMSKRSGEEATFVSEFRARGYLPEALLNFVVLLGWSWDGEQEIFTLPELIEKFSLERVGTTGAVFNTEKLEWMNGQYLKAMPLAHRVARVRAYLKETGREPDPTVVGDVDRFLTKAVHAVGDRMKTLADVEGYAGFAFRDPVEIAEDAKAELVRRPDSDYRLTELADTVEKVEPFDAEALEAAVRALAERLSVKPGDLFFPARVVLTGRRVAPGIFEVMLLLGRERTVARLRAGALLWRQEQAAIRQSS